MGFICRELMNRQHIIGNVSNNCLSWIKHICPLCKWWIGNISNKSPLFLNIVGAMSHITYIASPFLEPAIKYTECRLQGKNTIDVYLVLRHGTRKNVQDKTIEGETLFCLSISHSSVFPLSEVQLYFPSFRKNLSLVAYC